MATKPKKTASPSKRNGPSEEMLIGSLRRYVRARGAELLEDPNVTSVGIGRKVTGGRRGKQVVLQFTVASKAEPEALEALGTTPIPGTITVDGIEVPTDVIERSYKPDFRSVAEVESPARKRRLDTIEPGVSVGLASSEPPGAGTIGCIVFDQSDGTPYVLSNWHVLHGPDGALGDAVAQPGPHDDNRVRRNRLGVLRRSHLGLGGDCAVATIEDRAFRQEIFDLGVAPSKLGEPELDDKVVKSGRTTSVTHGIVRRIDTVAKINYGGHIGVKTIGCFEIGLDPAHLPADGEISKPGDSGATWMFKQGNGRPGTVMAGLHFAGEGKSDPDEHALACLSTSVFEKLEISLTPPAPEDIESIVGYDPDFLGERIEVPQLDADLVRDAVLLDGSEVIPYTHFSLTLSKKRRFPFWVAWNINGGSLKKLSRNGIPFVKDPRLPASAQVGNELYENNRLDRGHIARRADLLWGSLPEAKKANTDSFFYTNITPQMDDFNQSSKNGLWGRLEDAVFDDVEVDDLKVSVFGGPVFQDDDRVFRRLKIPREFWKVITFTEQGVLKAKAFLLTQNLNQLEALDLDEFRVFQVSLSELQERTQLLFPATLHKGDTLVVPEALADRTPLERLADIQWD
ncbi:DNA/RNA non-specific endonuclease [Streptomyces sp. V4I2]|uniref:DNA/RNA non-specific endonuclease n=1 Tax=Streptomyces sp. V4I2 TaxID=3042280 RepID=UPI0027804F9E|nr:DNA/RNA non-specific endonuclease [Streptomyces sp. V4I2]MDQ1051817.1 endonuclease G [Streptomyces sp. V4I2]